MWLGAASLALCAGPAFAQDEAGDDAPAAAETTAPAAEEPNSGSTPPRTFDSYASENAPTTAPSPSWNRITEAELHTPRQSYPNVEWHGYFRFRADSFWNLDLDTAGTSPILPPIESLLRPGTGTAFESSEIPAEGTDESGNTVPVTQHFNDGAEHIGGANIRFRLRPIFHVTENARIHLEMNILDNVVLGSTPDGFDSARGTNAGLRIDMPLIGFTGSQEPPNWWNSGGSSINVTQAYGEVNAFFGTLRMGRMASHWGLGILANGGGAYSTLREPRVSYRGVSMQGHGCLDCDYGDYVDRAMFVTNLFNTYVALAWDYNSSGPTTRRTDDYFGQPRAISNYDDVRSYVISIFQRPLRPEEIAVRERTLKELRQPVFDWGAYFVYRVQKLSTEAFNATERSIANYEFIVRGARAFIPDVWLRLQYEPAFRQRLRLEIEVAAILGSIENANPDPGSSYNPIRQRDIQQFGGALEFEYVRMALATGINAGFATGRTVEGVSPDDPTYPSGFGVIDTWAVSDSEPKLTNFRFDRNYFVDHLMFREVIGTITNAVYLAPFFQYDLYSKRDDALGVRLDVITGFAMNPDVTPSGNGFYGVETDVTVYWREPRFGTDIMAGLFIPGNAFNGVTGRRRIPNVNTILRQSAVYDSDVRATPAWTLQGRFFWAF